MKLGVVDVGGGEEPSCSIRGTPSGKTIRPVAGEPAKKANASGPTWWSRLQRDAVGRPFHRALRSANITPLSSESRPPIIRDLTFSGGFRRSFYGRKAQIAAWVFKGAEESIDITLMPAQLLKHAFVDDAVFPLGHTDYAVKGMG